MGVSAGPDKVPRLKIALLRNHAGKESVARDVEREPEEDIAASLIELTGEHSVKDIELEQRMAGERAILSSSPTFQAETTSLLESGLRFISSITLLI